MNSFLRVLFSLSVLLAGLLVAGTPRAAADTAIDNGFIQLGTRPLQLEAHGATGRVWVRGPDRIEVVDVRQGTVRGLDLAAVRDLAVNADGSKAYASAGSTIIEIDAATMNTRTFDIASDDCLGGRLAAGAVKVHFSACDGGVLDPQTGGVTGSPIPYGSPIDVPGRDRVLYQSGAKLAVVDGTDSTVLVQRELPYLPWDGPQVSSDGTRILIHSNTGGPVSVRDLDSLGPVGSLPSGGPESADSTLDLLGDLVLVARNWTSLYDLESGSSVNRLLPDSPQFWWVTTVTALNGDVVSGGWSRSSEGALFVESEPRVPAPDLTVDDTFPVDAFTPAPVKGRLTDHGAPMAGETIAVTDVHGNPLATTTTDAEGRFATEIRFRTGTAVVARWSGGTRPSAVSYGSVWNPPRTSTHLSISVPAQVSPGDSIPVTVHLRTARGADADGMEVDLYRRCDHAAGWASVASAVTGSDGMVSFSDPAPPCLEVEYLARHETTQQTGVAAMVASVMVTWQSSALELTTPDDITVGDPATVRARLLIDGQPAPARTVTLRAGAADAQTLVTDSDGYAAIETTFPDAGHQRVRWEFAGDDDVLPTWADTEVWIRKRGTTLSAEPSETSVTVTESVTISGTLTDERGEPVPDAELRLRHAGPEVVTQTASDGSYTAQVQPGWWHSEYRIGVSYQGDSAREATSNMTVIDVQPLWSSLSLTSDGARVAPGDEVTLSGVLTTEPQEDLSGEVVSVRRVDPDGTVTGVPAARVDAAGNFSFTDTPPVPGDVRYIVTHYGGNWYRTLDAEATVDVVPRVPAQLTLETDRNRYAAGDTAILSVAAAAGDEVLLTAEHFNGDVTTVYRGPLPAGGLTKRVVVRHTTTFVATVFQTVDHEAGSVSLTRPVRIGMTTTVPNAWGSTGGVRLVSPRVRPRFVTTVAPRRAGVCLRYEVQQRVEGGWRRRSSTCRWTDERGKATYTISRRPVGSRWRVRPVAQEDRLNAFTLGAWVEFRVRSRS